MNFTLGDKVLLESQVTHLKTAEPMSILRPSDLVVAEEMGEVIAMQASGMLAVEFNYGVFLVESTMLRSAS